MKDIILEVRESEYSLFLQFLRTLQYVKVKEAEPMTKPTNQLEHLLQWLQQQEKPLFPHIADPLEWQKQQRDEWS
ncbi:MAG: hypothetical protein LH618_00955 [Saprospiraceae bacterium]|nr:hypothetical protein [Saprospiraceae bacterium]